MGAEWSQTAARAVAAVPLWYHTIEVAPGLTTAGWFDLRPVVGRLPWPDVAGRRCLDVGTYDGFLAFELERRGASEVVAIDLADHRGWDWPWAKRRIGPEVLAAMAGESKAGGFETARGLLGSSVERRALSVYDLSPDEVGSFDVVVCGSLLLHLRDPVRALEAIRSVCRGALLSAETIDPLVTLARPRSPAARFKGGERCQWWLPNPPAHRRMVESAGFEVLRTSEKYAVPFGRAHPAARRRPAARVLRWLDGVPHVALLARPGGA